jgi:hypothetical protein
MGAREKLIAKIKSRSSDIRLEEVDRLLIYLGFEVRSTTHTYLYTNGRNVITFNRHYKILHKRAIKELHDLLDELLDW